MDLSNLFFWSNFAVLPFWALMILAPRWRWTQWLAAPPLIALVPALLYATLVLPRFVPIFGAVSTLSLGSIMPLLGTPEGSTVAWLHLDLLVGRWVYLDGSKRNVTP